MKLTKFTLAAALLATTMVIGAPSLHAQDNKDAKKGKGGGLGGGRMEQMVSDLKLTDEQKPKVEAAMKERREKMQEIRQDSALSNDEKSTKAKAATEAFNKKMKEILTKEQYEKFEKMAPAGGGGPEGGKRKKKDK